MQLIDLRERLVTPDPEKPERLDTSLVEFDRVREVVRDLAAGGDEVARQVLGASLWARAWRADRNYVEELYSRRAAALMQKAAQRAENDAEDLFQATFLRACLSVRKGRDRPPSSKARAGELVSPDAADENLASLDSADDALERKTAFLNWLADRGRDWLENGTDLPAGVRPAPSKEASWLETILYHEWCIRRSLPSFVDCDIRSPKGFVESLKRPLLIPLAVANFLRQELGAVIPQVEAEKDKNKKRRLLRVALNEMIKTPSLFRLYLDDVALQESLSTGVRMELQALFQQPGRWKRMFINRLILHALFPVFLAKPVILRITEMPVDSEGNQIEFIDDDACPPDEAIENQEAEKARQKTAEVDQSDLALYREDLKACVCALIDSQREAFVLRHIVGMDQMDGAKVAGAMNQNMEYDPTVFNNLTGRAVKKLRGEMAKRGCDIQWLSDPKSDVWYFLWGELRKAGYVPESPGGETIGLLDLLSECIRGLPVPLAEAFALEFLAGPEAQPTARLRNEPNFQAHLEAAVAAVVAHLQNRGRDVCPLLVLDPHSESRELFWEWLRNSTWRQNNLRRPSTVQP